MYVKNIQTVVPIFRQHQVVNLQLHMMNETYIYIFKYVFLI
jgi:hypothetical protein